MCFPTHGNLKIAVYPSHLILFFTFSLIEWQLQYVFNEFYITVIFSNTIIIMLITPTHFRCTPTIRMEIGSSACLQLNFYY